MYEDRYPKAVIHPPVKEYRKSRSDWRIVGFHDDEKVVFIEDLDLGRRSVTNDAENVIADLHRCNPGYRVIYKDSLGQWDELQHDGNGKFVGFKPLPRCFRPEITREGR